MGDSRLPAAVRSRLHSSLLALGALAALLALAGCGNKGGLVTASETEGPYLDVGPLQYQVQISRLLNPDDTEDRAYFIGVKGAHSLRPDEAWFAVFLRVKNPTGAEQQAARDFEIEDTQHNRYRPVAVGRDNVFAYRAGKLSPNGILPRPDTPAAESPIGGSMLLYRLTLSTLANRPLELKIFSASGPPPQGTVELDV